MFRDKGELEKSGAYKISYIFFFLFICFLFLVSSKCPRSEERPFDFLPGDVCARCKMHITEKRYAGEYVLKDGRIKKFDDLGCLALSYIEEKENVRRVWVVDFETGDWLDAEKSASFSSGFTTPMDYGFVAFEKSRCKGDCLNFNQFLERIAREQKE